MVNPVARQIEIYRQPEGGRYASVRRVGAAGVLDPAAVPEVTLSAAGLPRPPAE
jgi:hypothetical protein